VYQIVFIFFIFSKTKMKTVPNSFSIFSISQKQKWKLYQTAFWKQLQNSFSIQLQKLENRKQKTVWVNYQTQPKLLIFLGKDLVHSQGPTLRPKHMSPINILTFCGIISHINKFFYIKFREAGYEYI